MREHWLAGPTAHIWHLSFTFVWQPSLIASHKTRSGAESEPRSTYLHDAFLNHRKARGVSHVYPVIGGVLRKW